MSLYNMLFGMNPTADLLLAVLGIRRHDVQRFRNVFATRDGAFIKVYTRTGGGNRQDYPNLMLRSLPGFRESHDDEGDSTYATDVFDVPEQWRADVAALDDPLTHGIRREFAQHLSATLRRPPTASDRKHAAMVAEERALNRTQHSLANGHTFVPHDDSALEVALEHAEKNGGEPLNAWGILPLVLQPITNKDEYGRRTRVRVNYEWDIDEEYWAYARARFAENYPKAVAKIDDGVKRHLDARAARSKP